MLEMQSPMTSVDNKSYSERLEIEVERGLPLERMNVVVSSTEAETP